MDSVDSVDSVVRGGTLFDCVASRSMSDGCWRSHVLYATFAVAVGHEWFGVSPNIVWFLAASSVGPDGGSGGSCNRKDYDSLARGLAELTDLQDMIFLVSLSF